MLAAVGGILLGARAGDDEAVAAEPGFCDPPRPVARVAGQSVMVRMEGRATDDLTQARAGEIGGVVLFPPSDIAGERLAAELKRLQTAAREGNPRLPVAIDQEGGIVERLPALPPQLSRTRSRRTTTARPPCSRGERPASSCARSAST